MNQQDLIRCAAVAMAAGLATFAGADEIAVGFRETKEINVPSGGAAEQRAPVSVSADGNLYKTGAGTLTMPIGVTGTRLPAKIDVLGGRLALTQDAVAVDITPPACIAAKAAFWTDASEGRGLVTEPDGDTLRASRWCDRRETSLASPTMWYAEPDWANRIDPEPLWGVNPEVRTVDGRRVVYFGGTHSSQCMMFKRNGSKATLTGIRDYFIVMGVDRSYGCALGGSSDAMTPMFMMDLFTMGDDRLHFLYFRGDLGLSAYVSRQYLNGVRFDPYSAVPQKGFQLYENRCAGAFDTAEAIAFFQTYPDGNRSEGGDYLCEAIVFTDILAEAERLAVERYLMAKWNLSASGAALNTYALAAGTEAEVTAATDVENARFTGEGRLVKKGAGALTLQPGDGATFAGTASLEAGALRVWGGKTGLPPVELKAGQRLTVAELREPGADPATAAGQATVTLTATVADDAAAHAVVKDGNGPVRARSIAADVTTLQVKAGSLALDAALVAEDAADSEAGVVAAIDNADFEDVKPSMAVSPSSVYENFCDLGATYRWQRVSSRVSQQSYLFVADQGKYSHWGTWCSHPCPQGVQCLYLIADSGAYTTIRFPRRGRYVFSFLASARSVDARPTLDLLLGRSADTLESFGVFAAATAPFYRYYYRTPLVEAGEYRIGFQSRKSADTGVAIDDLRCEWLAEDDPAAVWQIPNGDFEKVNLGFYCNDPHANNTTEGWTLCTDKPASTILAHLTTPGIRDNGVRQYALGDVTWGGTQLALAPSGWATTTFTPPAGRYRLRGRVASNPDGTYSARTVGVRATVAMGGTAVDLGTVSTGRHSLDAFVWPQDFATDGETEVALTLTETAASAHALVDDFELVRVGGDDELFADPDFEDWRNPAWHVLDPAPAKYANTYASYHGYTGSEGGTPYVDIWGHNVYSGDTHVRICANGGVQQEVAFPSAGTYRLVFHERSRLYEPCGANPLSVWYRTLDGAKTNFLYRTASACNTNFVEHVCTFTVDRPGACVFAFQGTGVNLATNPGEGREVLLDGVSLRRVAGERAATPSVPASLNVEVSRGAVLNLNYPGCVRLESLHLGGRRATGLITAARYPEYLVGEGSVYVEPKGMSLIVR